MSTPVKPKKKLSFNFIEGEFEFITDNNFSYESVPVNKKLTISKNMQMAVFDEFDLDGELQLEGSMIMET